MVLVYQILEAGSGDWKTIGTIEASGAGGAVVRRDMDGYSAGKQPIFSPVLEREVAPTEGETYLMSLEQFGGSSSSRFVVADAGDEEGADGE